MAVQIATLDFEVHRVPYYELHIEDHNLVIEFDETNGSRIRITFAPYQAIRITAEDCFDLAILEGNYQRRLLEITDSKWINELRNTVVSYHHDPDLIERAHHYVLDLGDDYVEVVAWKYSISPAEK